MSTATDPSRTPSEAPAPPRRPTPLGERALAPDLARGMMLLLIALAHVPWFLYTADLGHALLHPAEGGLADRIAQVVTLTAVDARTHTMFAFLFAYGIGQLHTRQLVGGASNREARGLLRTRHLWMFVFGLVHAALLWQGDILGTYGLLGLLFVPLFLRRSDRTLKVWIGILLAVGAATCLAAAALPVAPPQPTDAQHLVVAEPDYLTSVGLRLGAWAPTVLSGLATLALPTAFLLGLLASRHRLLEEPARHLPLLRRTAIAGIAVGWGTGLLLGLSHVGVLDALSPMLLSTAHFYTGIFAGVGYAALFGLIGHRIAVRGTSPSLPTRALVSLGRRSLSGYLAQSVIFVPLLSAWGLGVGAHLSSWSAMLVGIASWLLTVVLAHALDRRGLRGPAEILLRRLSYRRSTR
ncbi:DUF418 domain-containing protein [Saccharopolyspora sp. MS10]|uniref:DUF418 domain-containing protein n=1 Tax=Saccharopolyspora sp. MS10 TaxID=3385973 RepID=UPI00399F684A